MVFGPGERCPALEMRLPTFTCGLVDNPSKYAPMIVAKHGREDASKAAAILIGAGFGCDAVLVGETPNQKWRAWARKHLDHESGHRAAAIWKSN